jgi:dienelactone hydrolase
MRLSVFSLLAVFLRLGVPAAESHAAARHAYTEFFYPSGSLRIQAYLYKPYGHGPFPVILYNHGSRAGHERESLPQGHIGNLLTRAGYAVLVSERRGYGRSDGPPSSEEVGNDRRRVVPRLQAETDDVLAALDYLRAQPYADMKRIGIMGWSYGGIVTMFAVSRSSAFAVAVNQAGGALSWENREVSGALKAAAEKSTTPVLLQVAKNDRTTSSITTLAEILDKRGVPHRAVIYEPFQTNRGDRKTPAGHKVFSSDGIQVWEKDVLEFLGHYLF